MCLEICPSCKELVDHSRISGDICEGCEYEIREDEESQYEIQQEKRRGELD